MTRFDLFQEIIDLFQADTQDERVDVLLKEFAEEASRYLQETDRSYLILSNISDKDIPGLEPIHYLLHDYNLRLKLVYSMHRAMIAVERLTGDEEGYQGIVVQTSTWDESFRWWHKKVKEG